MDALVTVEARVIGQRRASPPWSVALSNRPADAPIGLRELIATVVRAEVEAFRQRQAERRLWRVLTPVEIAAGAEVGKVDPGGHDLAPPVDAEAAVATALQAFEDGLYLVFVDGVQRQRLDQSITLARASRIGLVRLVPLAGG